MKVWLEYGSEHSAEIVMIGRFKRVEQAEQVQQLLEEAARKVWEELQPETTKRGGDPERVERELLERLRNEGIGAVTDEELEQFGFEVDLSREGSKLVLKTEEMDVSAFLKVLLESGARVEVFREGGEESEEE